MSLKLKIDDFITNFFRCSLLFTTVMVGNFIPIQFEYFCVYSAFVYIMILVLYYKKNRTIITPYIAIFLFMVLFHAGQLIVNVYAGEMYLPVIDDFNKNSLVTASIYSLMCIQIFDLSYNVSGMTFSKRESDAKSSAEYLNFAYSVSILLLIILTPIIFADTFSMMVYSLKYGYMSLYSYDGEGYSQSAVMPYLRNFFVIIGILNITSASYHKKKAMIPMFLLFTYSFMMFVTGFRSGLLSVLLPLVFIYVNNIRNNQKGDIIKIGAIVVGLMVASVFMSYYRLQGSETGGFAEALTYIRENNPITQTFIEMGNSLKPMMYCVEIFNTGEQFKLGQSYLSSVFLLIPNVFNILGDVHPASQGASLAQWLMEAKNLNHGPGFSIIAESYYNFGKYGCLIFVIWGMFVSIIFGNSKQQNEERTFISYATLTLLISLIRGTTADFMRSFVYEVIIFSFLLRLAFLIYKQKRGNLNESLSCDCNL